MIRIKIAVCIKQVPGTTEIKIDPETNTLVREGIENIINPFDTYAVEEGVRIKERFENSDNSSEEVEVIALSMGPPQSKEILLQHSPDSYHAQLIMLIQKVMLMHT